MKLRHYGLNVDDVDEPSHGGWNDEKNTLKEVGLYKHVLAMAAAMNLNYGTIYSPDRQGQVADATHDQVTLLAPRVDVVFQDLLPGMLEEDERGDLKGDPNAENIVYGELRSADPRLDNKGDKVGMCRFYGVIRRSRTEGKVWSRRTYRVRTTGCNERVI